MAGIYVAYAFRRETIKVVSFPPKWLMQVTARVRAGNKPAANPHWEAENNAEFSFHIQYAIFVNLHILPFSS